MSLMRLVTMFQGNNVLKFLFKIVNQLQEKNVPLFQDKNTVVVNQQCSKVQHSNQQCTRAEIQ